MIKRRECVLCDGKLNEFHRINYMPSFMGVVDSNDNVVNEDMIFGECDSCGLLQNINLLDSEIVYLNNHNTEIVGETWKKHYIELSNFIKENSKGDIILEIGDPSAKIANILKENYKKWVIIEPNTELVNYDNIEIIKGFFEGNNPTNYKINTIVHSHVFEHLYDPIKFLKDCNMILEEEGVILFSIPNIKWLLDNNSLPTGILHFEHTYYINKGNVELFLNKCGFKLNEIYEYKTHSLFIKATKDKNVDKITHFNKVNDIKKFMGLVYFYNEKIDQINKEIGENEYYLYSAHINSQYLLNNGINKNIKGLLDMSDSKIGKKLYGYDYNIFSPNKIINEKNPVVVASHMGAYYNEIKENLLRINPNTTIL